MDPVMFGQKYPVVLVEEPKTGTEKLIIDLEEVKSDCDTLQR
jgi:hypothetical protein